LQGKRKVEFETSGAKAEIESQGFTRCATSEQGIKKARLTVSRAGNFASGAYRNQMVNFCESVCTGVYLTV
jgi:hypothetical protein